MKIIITTALALLLSVGAANAQNANIGVKGGLNAFMLTNDNNTLKNTKLGYHLGLIGHFHISEKFALQPELVYSLQGSKYTILGSEVNLNLNYLNVPVLFQYMFNNGFRVQAGPQLGFLAGAKTKIGSTKTTVTDGYETIDFSLTAGVSFIDPRSDFGIDLRYNHGFTNVIKNANPNAYNRGIQLGIFYLFNHE